MLEVSSHEKHQSSCFCGTIANALQCCLLSETQISMAIFNIWIFLQELFPGRGLHFSVEGGWFFYGRSFIFRQGAPCEGGHLIMRGRGQGQGVQSRGRGGGGGARTPYNHLEICRTGELVRMFPTFYIKSGLILLKFLYDILSEKF